MKALQRFCVSLIVASMTVIVVPQVPAQIVCSYWQEYDGGCTWESATNTLTCSQIWTFVDNCPPSGGGGGGGGGAGGGGGFGSLWDTNGDGLLDCWRDSVGGGYNPITETDPCYSYGALSPPCHHSQSPHMGQDIVADCGSYVRGAGTGWVREAGFDQGMGNYIRLEMDSGLWAIYMHLDSMDVAVGAHIVVGDIIGRVGSTGNSTGCHLHLQIQDVSRTSDFNQTFDPTQLLGVC